MIQRHGDSLVRGMGGSISRADLGPFWEVDLVGKHRLSSQTTEKEIMIACNVL